jgi:glycosyltransferase involved in cell wall biosynthesis
MNHISKTNNYELFFCYRNYKKYQEGINRDLSKEINILPLFLFSNSNVFQLINKIYAPVYIKNILKVPFAIIEEFGVFSIINYFILKYYFREIQPKIIHINNGGYPGSYICQTAVFAAKKICSNIIYHINNPAKNRKCFIKKIIDKKINRIVKFFITASNDALISLEKVCTFDKQKLIQIFNTIEDPIIFKNKFQILKEFGLSENKFIITEVGFLSKRKGQIYLLRALKKIKDEEPDIYSNIVIFLIGDGSDYHFLKNFVIRNKINKHVIFTKYVSNYCDFINASDIFILPSIEKEDMPLVVLSAMALKKTIIASKVAGIAEEIEDQISGKLIEVNQLSNLYIEIVKLYNDEKLRQYYSENAYYRFNKLFSQKKIYQEFINIYTTLSI